MSRQQPRYETAAQDLRDAPPGAHGAGDGGTPGRGSAQLTVAVFSDALPGRSGVGTYYDDLCEHLQGEVGRVVVVAPSRDEARARFPRSVPLPGDSTQRLYLPPLRAIWRKMKRASPQVVVCATPGPYGALGMLVAERMGAGLCIGLHTRFDDLAGLYWKRLLGPTFGPILRFWDRVMFRRAHAVLVNNDELLARTREEGVSHARLVGTPAPRAFLAKPLTPTRSTLSCVAFIGRLAPEKRLDEVLRSADEFPDVRFRIAGDGPLREEVDGWAAARSNVESMGWVGREKVLEVLDDADLLVLPSRYETFGTIALEALARGKPALVSPHCGISRWPELADGLFSMRAEEPLVEAIGRIRELGPEARREKARSGRAAAEALTRRTVLDWLEVIEDVGEATPAR